MEAAVSSTGPRQDTTVSLSSGEAELHGIAAGMAQALGLQALAKDLGFHVTIDVLPDATAAIGIARRRGMGQIRHLDCTDLWIQETKTIQAKLPRKSARLGASRRHVDQVGPSCTAHNRSSLNENWYYERSTQCSPCRNGYSLQVCQCFTTPELSVDDYVNLFDSITATDQY